MRLCVFAGMKFDGILSKSSLAPTWVRERSSGVDTRDNLALQAYLPPNASVAL